MSGSKWYPFDVEKGYDVRREDPWWLLRDSEGAIVQLTDEEFNQLRSPEENPRGLL